MIYFRKNNKLNELKEYAYKKDNIQALNHLDIHCHNIEDYKNMKIHYLTAIQKNNIYSMFNLARYYHYLKHNCNKSLKYFTMPFNYDKAYKDSDFIVLYKHIIYGNNKIKDIGFIKKLINNGCQTFDNINITDELKAYMNEVNKYKEKVIKAVNIVPRRFIIQNYNTMVTLLVINKFYDVMIDDVMNNVIIKYLFI